MFISKKSRKLTLISIRWYRVCHSSFGTTSERFTMKKLMVILAFLAPTMSSAAALKYICTVDTPDKFNEADSQFAIVYANNYEVVYPAKSLCMSHLNLLTCQFVYDGYTYRLEVDITKAYSPMYQKSGRVTKMGWIRSTKSTVSCYLRN